MAKKGIHSKCVHDGEIRDEQFGGAISPIYMATSYPFLGDGPKRYPRYFNPPNQEEREKIGISDHLLRFSVGIEDQEDIIADLEQAFDEVR